MAEEDFFKDYPNRAEGTAATAGSGADFFGGDVSGQPAQPVNGSAGTENYGFVMPDAPQAEQVTVEDAAEDEDDDEDEGAEPAAIKQWRIDFAARLEKKQDYEKKLRADTRQDAKETLQKMHERWQQRVESNKQTNEEYEKKFVSDRDAILAQFSRPGEKPNWNVVPHLANLSGNYTEGQRDTSRMRSVILKLKTG